MSGRNIRQDELVKFLLSLKVKKFYLFLLAGGCILLNAFQSPFKVWRATAC